MKTWMCLLLFCMLVAHAKAQELKITPEVLATAGAFQQSGTLQMEWTLGELAIQQHASNNLELGEGFHQGVYGILTVSYEAPELDFTIDVFPNPFQDRLNVQTEISRPLTYELLDLTGRTIKSHVANSPKTEWNVNDLPSAVYFLRVMDKNGLLLKTVKLIKTNL